MNNNYKPLGSNAWFVEQEKAEQEKAAAAAEAARNQPVPVPQTVEQQVFAEAAALYDKRMTEERAKTAAQREVETLTAEAGTLSATMNEQYRNPSRFANELQVGKKRMDEIFRRLEVLKAVPDRHQTGVSNDGSVRLVNDSIDITSLRYG